MQHGSTGLMRFYASKALVAMSPEAAEGAAAEIVSLLKPSVDFYRQEEAIQFLGDLGPRARGVLPQLRETLESRDWKWRRAARDAIEKIQK